ncbi:hypothetical protein ACWD3I_08220 [Streptomyces sp. NPDC002817]|uniref:hypothetical protein n=1 Tax=Streptomyces sp. NPDC088357 TaxID=3154655 RepID=UPI003449EB0E
MRRRVSAVALAVAAGVPLLGGCGIQETDVIEAGGPASVQAFLNREDDMLLFFRSPDGGLSPVIRSAGPETVSGEGSAVHTTTAGDQDATQPVPTEKVVSALLAGPADEDRAAGLTTALPAARPGGTVKVDASLSGRVTTRLPLALEGLDTIALRQLTCTIAYSQDADGRIVVELRGQDGASRSGTCGLAPGSAGNVPTVTETRERGSSAGASG